MTQHELAELLRDHVTHDEPPVPLPHPAVAAGRRRLRARRLTRAGVAAAALAVAGAVVVPRLGGGETTTAMDPASAAALAEYDALAMPRLMDDHVRRVLERTVPDLGPSRFRATDDQLQVLPERYWDKASGMRVVFGPRTHQYEVDISHARGEAEGNPERYCADGLAAGYYLECTVDRMPGGDVAIEKLFAVSAEVTGSWKSVDDLTRADPSDLWFVREVKVVKSETLVTYVTERVKVTDPDPAAAPFTTPYADLVAIGTDPVLVMPLPPPGDGNGCPQWSLPVSEGGVDVFCGTAP